MEESKYKNKEISTLLRNIAAAYLLNGGNRFKIIAYEKAADTVEHLSRELKDIWQDGKLSEVPSFGPSIESNIDEYFRTGASKHFESVLAGIPQTVFMLMKVPGIGPKKASKIVMELKLFNTETIFADIKAAALANKIAVIPSFGDKSQTDILEAIERYEKNDHNGERMPLPLADDLARQIIEYLKEIPSITRVDALGSLRRMVTTIGDIDIAVQAPKEEASNIVEHFIKFPGNIHTDNKGEEKASIIVASQVRVDLRVQPIQSYGSMLQYFTGSKAHNIKLREYALKRGFSLNEYGIKCLEETQNSKLKIQNYNSKLKIFEFDTEEKYYNFLDLQYVPPEIREGTNEVDLAKKNKLPALVEISDIIGDLHMHSSYDLKPSHDLGQHTYEEMLEYASSKGYKYIGFADHNPKVTGHTEQEIINIMKRRKEYIDEKLEARSKELGIKYFIGLETDITPSGELALPEKAIEYVDYLVVSVHSSFNLGIKEMTNRVLRALAYPKVKILGHPTGRLINKREGFELEWEKIFQYAHEYDIAMEINASPSRLDLPDTLVRDGLKYGVKYSIDTDAHAREQMDLMLYGVSVARRGWCEKKNIVNTMGYNEFKAWLLNS